MRNTIVFSLLAMLIFSACDKDKNDPKPTSSGSYLEFYNPYEQAVFLSCVDTTPPRSASSPIYSMEYIIPPGHTIHMPDSTVIKAHGEGYHFFWVTADLQYSNWWAKGDGAANTPEQGFKMDTTTFRRIVLTAAKDDILITLARPRNSPDFKVDFLHYRDTARYTTNWKAVDAYDSSGNSVWNKLTPDEQRLLFTPYLWRTFSIESKNNNSITKEDFLAGISNYLGRNANTVIGSNHHITGYDTIPFIAKQYKPIHTLGTNSIDTAFLWRGFNSNLIYKMAKQ